VKPLAQVVGPVHPVPPHCPHCVCVGPAAVVEDETVVGVVVGLVGVVVGPVVVGPTVVVGPVEPELPLPMTVLMVPDSM